MKITEVIVNRRIVTGKYEHIDIVVSCSDINNSVEDLGIENAIREIDIQIMNYKNELLKKR